MLVVSIIVLIANEVEQCLTHLLELSSYLLVVDLLLLLKFRLLALLVLDSCEEGSEVGSISVNVCGGGRLVVLGEEGGGANIGESSFSLAAAVAGGG